MCLAVPALIIEVNEDGLGLVDHAGNRREISLLLLEDPQPGEYVIIHAGFAIQKYQPEEAEELMELWRKVREGAD